MKSALTGPAFVLLAALAASATPAVAASPQKVAGSIVGIVRDGAGIPQMGATVFLFNRYERMIQRALTNDRGSFGFDPLPPDIYSVRVSLASFVPAVKHKIEVQPGMQSLLYINLATLLSSIELVYTSPGQGALMSDDWKWTLKSAASTRPILRLIPGISISDPNASPRVAGSIFSETRGLLRVSAGDSSVSDDLSVQPDLGTAFALATSIYGRSKLQVSGNVGYTARSDVPAASFRVSYALDSGGPEIAVTMRQVYLPSREASAAVGLGQTDGLPALRTIAASVFDHADLTDDLLLEYGTSLNSVAFVDHLNIVSPFARLTYNLGSKGTVRAAYSAGAPPTELFIRSGEEEVSLHDGLSALNMMPRVSLKDGRAAIQRTQSAEVGYEKKFRSRTLNLTAYHESVANGTLMLSGGEGQYLAGDTIPTFGGTGATVDIGSYERYGYSASMTQEIGEKVEIAAAVGRAGVLAAGSPLENGTTGEEFRSKIHTSQRYWASVRATGTVPVTGTQISGSYEWMDYNTILPTHLYLTQSNMPDAGLNVHVRQPIRSFPGFSGRLEATADMRNLFAQGYMSVPNTGGRQLMLLQSPRAVRGGLSFIF